LDRINFVAKRTVMQGKFRQQFAKGFFQVFLLQGLKLYIELT